MRFPVGVDFAFQCPLTYLCFALQAGCQNKPTVFLFDETQIVQETFLEDINNILTSGGHVATRLHNKAEDVPQTPYVNVMC